MTRLLARSLYFARTAVSGLRQSPVTSVVAVVTIGVSLVLVGAFALLLSNMEEILSELGDELQVTAYLEGGLSEADRSDLAQRVRSLPGVEQVRVVSEAQALERFGRGVGRGAALLEGLGENPLPASFEVVLASQHRSADGLAVVGAALEALPGIDDVASGADWVEGYLRVIALVRAVGWGLGLVVGLATLLIIANTIRLAVYARRDELQILSLVGASRSFVNTPFLLEGVLEGAVGGVVALALLYGAFRLVLPGFEFGLELVLGTAPVFFSLGEAAALVGAGAGLGFFGSAAAVSGGWRP